MPNKLKPQFWLLLLAIPGFVAMLVPTPVVGHDSWLHLIWLEQFAALVREGVLYPRWLPLSNGGLGSPTYYFYPPLTAFIGTLPALIGNAIREIDQFRFVAYIASIAGLLSFRYYLSKLGLRPVVQWGGALLYASLPYRAVDLVLRNALGEHLAFVWIPLVFASVEMLGEHAGAARGPRRAGLLLLALATALLILSNIPTAAAVLLALPLYLFVRYRGAWRVYLDAAISVVAGLTLPAFYLVPALTLREHVQTQHLWDAGTSRSGAAFTILELTEKASNPLTNANAVMLLLAIGVLAAALVMRKRAKAKAPVEDKVNQDRRILAWCAVSGLGLIMQLPGLGASLHGLPVIEYLQFSWRWNLLLVPAIAALVALLSARSRAIPILAAILATAATIAVVFSFSKRYERHQSADLLKIEYSDAFEYIPRTAPSRTHDIARLVSSHLQDPPATVMGAGRLLSAVRERDEMKYEFELLRPSSVTFHRFYWPLWRLDVGGREVPLHADSLGRVLADFPAGRVTATLSRKRDNSETVGALVSLTALMACIGAIILMKRKNDSK